MKKSSQIVRWESPYLSKGKPLVKMNYVSMQIHRFSWSLAMVVLGDFSTLCSHFCARRARDALHSTLTVGVQKKALEPKFSLVGWVFHFSILERRVSKLLNWVFGETKANQAESSVWILYHFLLCFFSDTSQAFLEALVVSWGGWIILKVPEGDESDHPSSNGRHHLKNQRERRTEKEKSKSPFSSLQKLPRKTRSFGPLFSDHRRASSSKK